MRQRIFTRDIVLILAASFLYMASPMLVTPLITGFSEHLGASAGVMGLVGGLTNLSTLIFQPFSGNLADRISKYRLSTIGTLFLVIACVGYAVSVRPSMILAFRIINGLGFACCSVCFSTWMSILLPKDKIGFGMGLYGMMNALGMAIAPAIGVALYQRFGYRVAFAAAAAFAALSSLVIQFTKDKGVPVYKQDCIEKKFRLVDRNVIPVALVIMSFTIPYCATQSFLVRYVETQNLPVTVGLFFTIYAAALLILRLIFRNLFDRGSFLMFMSFSTVCSLLSMLFLFLMKSNFGMAAAAVFMAGSYGIMCTVSQSVAVLLADPENRGLANSTYYLGLNSGMALGPIIGGMLYGSIPIQLFYPALMFTAPLGFLLYFGSRKLLNVRTNQRE